MNFAKGILETRQQTYRHLKNILKTIPLDTPTTIELSPGNELRVTMLDANHCVGAVMFLIQGDGKAILYTGDIRAETWWVNSLVRNPVLIPYTLGTRRLDCIYLDTTFATKADLYREFPSKAEGLRELLSKVEQYPKDTVFHFNAWTFGYENAWIALCATLGSPIHLDKYRWSLYNSLTTNNSMLVAQEAPPLCGFFLGNHWKDGCLTTNPDVRLHSCERGTACPVFNEVKDVVQITPIISRLKTGVEVHEIGAGGGKGDLDQVHELEVHDAAVLGQLMALCAAKIKDPQLLSSVLAMLTSAMGSEYSKIRLDAGLDNGVTLNDATLDELPLQDLVDILTRLAVNILNAENDSKQTSSTPQTVTLPLEGRALPRTITFPYSRHASYSELCDLISAFKPQDIWPCTVDEDGWTTSVSMRALFGHLCSAGTFVHDKLMLAKQRMREGSQSSKRSGEGTPVNLENTQSTSSPPASSQAAEYHTAPAATVGVDRTQMSPSQDEEPQLDDGSLPSPPVRSARPAMGIEDRRPQTTLAGSRYSSSSCVSMSDGATVTSPSGTIGRAPASTPHSTVRTQNASKFSAQIVGSGHSHRTAQSIREWAYRAAVELDGYTWADFGGLLCVRDDASKEVEL